MNLQIFMHFKGSLGTKKSRDILGVVFRLGVIDASLALIAALETKSRTMWCAGLSILLPSRVSDLKIEVSETASFEYHYL